MNISLYKIMNGGQMKATKHIHYRLLHGREMVSDELLSVDHIGTKFLPADLMTKALRVAADFHYLRSLFMYVKNKNTVIE